MSKIAETEHTFSHLSCVAPLDIDPVCCSRDWWHRRKTAGVFWLQLFGPELLPESRIECQAEDVKRRGAYSSTGGSCPITIAPELALDVRERPSCKLQSCKQPAQRQSSFLNCPAHALLPTEPLRARPHLFADFFLCCEKKSLACLMRGETANSLDH